MDVIWSVNYTYFESVSQCALWLLVDSHSVAIIEQ